MKRAPLSPALTPEQHHALRAFAQQHGRTWKHQLWILWMQAAAPPILHGLRNTHGPSWLVRYRLSATTPPLTLEQHEALHAFAQQHGRTWKRELRRLWMQASAPPLLHALRTTHGPRWLLRYRPWPDAARKR